jgi:hypothetical protein
MDIVGGSFLTHNLRTNPYMPTDVRPAGVRLVSLRGVRARWGAIGAEPFGEVGNRIQGANCLSAASYCPAGSAPWRTGQSQRQGCPFFCFFSLGKQRKESPSRRETKGGDYNFGS